MSTTTEIPEVDEDDLRKLPAALSIKAHRHDLPSKRGSANIIKTHEALGLFDIVDVSDDDDDDEEELKAELQEIRVVRKDADHDANLLYDVVVRTDDLLAQVDDICADFKAQCVDNW